VMDPVEAGDCLGGRPQQLIFLTGLDPNNRESHSALVSTFGVRSQDRPPLNLRLVSAELELPLGSEKLTGRGILRRDWPSKYLDRVPALIVLFLDLDWDHPSWSEKKTEAESKCASLRSSATHGSRLAVVLLQQRAVPIPSDDPLATERAHELCQICRLTPRQLFVVPMLGDLAGYVSKLESAFHELAQGFYQQKLKTIRARSIPNNSPALVVRQLFKLAFISELRQDTHTAYRNYRLAYEQCKDHMESWDGVDIFEWRTVVGILNYKICELCFLHNMAVEAINQMRRHQAIFFAGPTGIYPSPQLANIELQLWNAKQCWHFAQLFEQAVVNGLTALATLNPGTHLGLAASLYSAVNKNILALKKSSPITKPYPVPDPMANIQNTVFFGQRPWRIGYDRLAPPNVEEDAVTAILHRLVVNYEGVISLLNAAMVQFKKYGCFRMYRKGIIEKASVYYQSGDLVRALQLWVAVVREGIPPAIRLDILQKAISAAYCAASLKDYVWCCVQLMLNLPAAEEGLRAVLRCQPPAPPFSQNDVTPAQMAQYQQNWVKLFTERQFFSIQASHIDTFVTVQAAFLETDPVQLDAKVPVRICLRSSAVHPICLSAAVVGCDIERRRRNPVAVSDVMPLVQALRQSITLEPKKKTAVIVMLDLSKAQIQKGQTLWITRVCLEIGDRHSKMFGQLEYNFDHTVLQSQRPRSEFGSNMLRIAASDGDLEANPSSTRVSCLVAEIAAATLELKNTCNHRIEAVRLDFKRNEQQTTEAIAVLFVDENDELRSELTIVGAEAVESGETIHVPVRFSAQLVGNIDLELETSYLLLGETRRRTGRIHLTITAREPLSVNSGVLSMNGLPLASILNHSEYVIKAEVTANANIIITHVEWLLADVLTPIGEQVCAKTTEDYLSESEVITYCCAVAIKTSEDDVETPLGRLAIEWKRTDGVSTVRSVVPLCRVPLVQCPITISGTLVDPRAATVRNPIRVAYSIQSHSKEPIELTASFDLADMFMFCGEKRKTFQLLPFAIHSIVVVVMALTAGRLPFPKIALKSPDIAEDTLQHTSHALPANLFVLPCVKETTMSDV
uniref:Foie-gras_1 domain-containing protein n=1 Tax=Haemonchus contortus TaxID=6289 RepID=A0A7I4YAL7_HAECO